MAVINIPDFITNTYHHPYPLPSPWGIQRDEKEVAFRLTFLGAWMFTASNSNVWYKNPLFTYDVMLALNSHLIKNGWLKYSTLRDRIQGWVLEENARV